MATDQSRPLPARARLLSGLAATLIGFGLFGAVLIALGAAQGPPMVPAAICVLAGLLAAGYHALRRQPMLALGILNLASLLLLIGAQGLTATLPPPGS